MAADGRAATERIIRSDEPAGAGVAMWLCAALFVVAFYFTGIADAALGSRAFDYVNVGGGVAFVFVALSLYAAAALGCWGFTRSLALPRWLRAAAERTGLRGAEMALALAVLIAGAAVVATRSLLYAPLVLALAVPAVATFFRDASRRPVAELPIPGAPSGAHFWMEAELPEIDPDVALPATHGFRHLQWRFDESLSTCPRFEHDLVYSVQTLADMQQLIAETRRTDYDLIRYLAVAGITREVYAAAQELRRLSVARAYGVLDEIANCVALLDGEVALVVPAADDGAVYGAGTDAGDGNPGPVDSPALADPVAVQPPASTLVRGSGSLESMHALLASLLCSLGHDVILIETEAGVAVGIGGADGMPGAYVAHEGRLFYFAARDPERGWIVGDVPAELAEGITGTLAVRVG